MIRLCCQKHSLGEWTEAGGPGWEARKGNRPHLGGKRMRPILQGFWAQGTGSASHQRRGRTALRNTQAGPCLWPPLSIRKKTTRMTTEDLQVYFLVAVIMLQLRKMLTSGEADANVHGNSVPHLQLFCESKMILKLRVFKNL